MTKTTLKLTTLFAACANRGLRGPFYLLSCNDLYRVWLRRNFLAPSSLLQNLRKDDCNDDAEDQVDILDIFNIELEATLRQFKFSLHVGEFTEEEPLWRPPCYQLTVR